MPTTRPTSPARTIAARVAGMKSSPASFVSIAAVKAPMPWKAAWPRLICPQKPVMRLRLSAMITAIDTVVIRLIS